MRELDAGDVVGSRRFFSSRSVDFRYWDIEKLRPRIDEAAHQPRAGDAVDLRPLAGHPARRGVWRLGSELSAFLAPMLYTALEILRAQRLRRVLAHFVAVHAVDDQGGAAREGLRPVGDRGGIASQRPADQIFRFEKALVAPHVDDERRRAAAKGLPEFFCTDARVHALSLRVCRRLGREASWDCREPAIP